MLFSSRRLAKIVRQESQVNLRGRFALLKKVPLIKNDTFGETKCYRLRSCHDRHIATAIHTGINITDQDIIHTGLNITNYYVRRVGFSQNRIVFEKQTRTGSSQ